MLSSPEVLPLITTTSQAFSEAVGIGIGKRPMPASMRSMLEQNVFIFSGFKTHAELSAVSALLIGDDGKKKPFEQFARDVRAIDENYNLNYLRAEYNFATQSARSAAQWAEYQTDADQFYLQYRTAADERVRESHALLHDTTLPASDPFWQKFFPPNGWNCRCTVVQVRKSKYPLSDSKKAIANGEKATTALNKKGQNKLAIFRFNPGAEQKIFPPRHPYLPKPSQLGCKDCNLHKLDMNPKNKFCLACKNLGICEAAVGIQKQAKINFLEWAKENKLDNYKYYRKEFGDSPAELSIGSIKHILQFSNTFYAKLDVLNNIEEYLIESAEIYEEPVEHDKDIVEKILTSVQPYNGSIKEFKGEDIEITFRKTFGNNFSIYSILVK